MTEESSLDEIIDLFVDINQEGVAVSRFAVVKAMGKKNALLSSTFSLIAEKQTRGHDIFYRSKRNEFTSVLKTLKVVSSTADLNSQVDRMWERLLELVLFAQTEQHRPPTEVLKGFITNTGLTPMRKPTSPEISQLRRVFKFLKGAYAESPSLESSSLAVNQVHFYTVITSLIQSDLLDTIDGPVLIQKLTRFGRFIDKIDALPQDKSLKTLVSKYMAESQTQTTHVGRRDKRQDYFLQAIRGIVVKPPDSDHGAMS